MRILISESIPDKHLEKPMPTIEEDTARAEELRAAIEKAIDLGSHYGDEMRELSAIEKRLDEHKASKDKTIKPIPPSVTNTHPGTGHPKYSVHTESPIYRSKIAEFLKDKKWKLSRAGAGISGHPRNPLGLGGNETCFSICLYEEGKPNPEYATLIHATASQPSICIYRSPRAIALGKWLPGFYETITFNEAVDVFHDLCRFIPHLVKDEEACENLLHAVNVYLLKS